MSRGRPKAKIDEEQLEKLAEKLWSHEQIAAFFRVDVRTVERRFAAKIKECRQRGTAKIIDLQWKRAEEGSDRMIMHMSAHHLNQAQKLELAVEKIPDEVLIQEAQRRINEKNKP